MAELLAVPKRPNNINHVVNDPTKSYITAEGHSVSQQRVLAVTKDDVETQVSFRTYDRMERDSNIIKDKRILITSVLNDDLQMAPGASEDAVSEEEYSTYVFFQGFAQRVISGLDRPYREILEQLYGNALKYGHGIGEIEWDYRMDAPSSESDDSDDSAEPPSKVTSAVQRFKHFFMGQDRLSMDAKPNIDGSRPSLKGEKTRLMPASVKVKPRGTTNFVVDDYMNVLGLVPASRVSSGLAYNEIIDRRKFMVLTLNKQNEDPRGVSSYRPAVNWYNLKTQIPAEIMRFILDESVPKAVATLPENMPPFEFERDENGNIVYDDPGTNKQPRMRTSAESFKAQIEGFRSGSGAVIPFGATLEPYKKGLTGANDADLFAKILRIVNTEMEGSILLQTLAQSEGEHQSKSASQQVAEVLYNLVFWTRWQLSMMTIFDLLSEAFRVNFGEWSLRYMPQISLGDFVRRDWVTELEVISKAYFQGFIDDSQREELMMWLNLPKPGESRQSMGQDALAVADPNGEPTQSVNNRPDKQAGTDKRNIGNGTEKNKNAKTKRNNATTGRGPVNFLGNDSRWFRRS